MEDIINRHEKIALQVSGGRDSLASLYLMHPYLDRITVYWVNTGNAYPETVEVMARVREMVPHFVEIDGRQPEVVAMFGLPSDIVPASHTPIGIMGSGGTGPVIQDRYSCCSRVIMVPLHQRMLDDGITLIIRGQKNSDTLKGTLRSGAVENGIEYLYPVEDWDSAKVTQYLLAENAPLPRYYEMLDGAPDCMTCSAYWENGVGPYLKRYHYESYLEYQSRLDIINGAVADSIAAFNKEVNT